MNILITGIAGFVGHKLSSYLIDHGESVQIYGIDNLVRRGGEFNVARLQASGVKFVHGDIRLKEDIDELPKVDWIIDCAAIPTVTAGLQGGTSQVVSHNLIGTLNLLEKCRRDGAGFVMLSTSRVYSISSLYQIPLTEKADAFQIDSIKPSPLGFSVKGINESFSTMPPVSLYGATKLASEVMALEYGASFHFPVFINRCGVLAGPGQFGKIDQGIFSYWIYQWLLDRPLRYIGFGGTGKQVRDFFHPDDLADLVLQQIKFPDKGKETKILNVGGGVNSSLSLKQLNNWCQREFKREKKIDTDLTTRPFDIPLYITDYSQAEKIWNWKPSISSDVILEQIHRYATDHRDLIASFS